MTGYVKICGITTPADARMCADAGVSAIGLNLWPSSPRCVSLTEAVAIAKAVRGRVEVVAVFVNPSAAELGKVSETLAPDRLQLHGEESSDLVRAHLPRAFKAMSLMTLSDVAKASALPGSVVLVDAPHDGERGGTGKLANLALARDVALARPTILAGGLTPNNVAEAIGLVRPFGVDVASGVEHDKRNKDAAKVTAFVRAARQAFAEIADV